MNRKGWDLHRILQIYCLNPKHLEYVHKLRKLRAAEGCISTAQVNVCLNPGMAPQSPNRSYVFGLIYKEF